MSKRNTSIDYLKISAMFMIVVLHLMNHGGFSGSVRMGSLNFSVSWIFNCLGMLAVNVYALCTGYLMSTRKPKTRSILNLWIMVLVYNVVLRMLMTVLTSESYPLSAYLFPVLNREYWYFNAYIPLFFLIPYFNRVIDGIEQRDGLRLVLILFVIFSVLPTLTESALFGSGTNNGYTTFWLMIVYFFGAIIRIHEAWLRCHHRSLIILFLVAFLGMVLWVHGITFAHSINRLKSFDRYLLLSYTSPLNVLASVSLFALIATTRFKATKHQNVLSWIATATFAVYLIHDKPIIRNTFIRNATQKLVYLPWYQSISIIFGVALIIFGTCLSIEWFRQQGTRVFTKIIKRE